MKITKNKTGHCTYGACKRPPMQPTGFFCDQHPKQWPPPVSGPWPLAPLPKKTKKKES